MKNSILKLFFIGLMTASSAWAAPGAATLPIVQVYKDPACGCCTAWIKHMQANGFQVVAHDTNDVAAHKRRLGVPFGIGSCHTAEVDGYLVEGHVPARDIRRLLNEHPSVRGLAVPGMPTGSPGMEEGGRKDAFDVLRIERDGSTRAYAHD